jgi:hypothetical protein
MELITAIKRVSSFDPMLKDLYHIIINTLPYCGMELITAVKRLIV